MAIVALWDDNARTRVHVEFETDWTWADLEKAINATDTLIASVNHAVDIIIDIEGSNIPKDFMTAAQKLLANPEARQNEGRRVVVGANGFIRTAYQTIQKAFGDKLNGREILFAQDISQARSMLYSMRLDKNS